MANAIVIYRGKPKIHSWARWMVGRTTRNNQNNLTSFVGRTGSGKTLSALSTCEIMARMDKVPFTIEHVVFSLRELMDLINSGTLRRGSKIVFDEPQISISAREFQSLANKTFNYLISTFRHRNFSLFFVTPFEKLLDLSTRKLFHARFETMSINRNTQTCRLKPRFIEYSDYKADPYVKQLIVFYKDKYNNNKQSKLAFWDIPRPSKELEEAYEKKKLEFTTRLNQNISLQLRKYDESGKSMTAEIKPEERKPLTERQEEIMRTLAKHGWKKSVEILGLSPGTVGGHRDGAFKKGYTLEEFQNATESQ